MIDTPERRRMAIDFGKYCGTGMPIPMGHIFIEQRAHVLNLYLEPEVNPGPIFFWRNKNIIGGSWTGKSSPVSAWKGKSSPETNWQGKNPPGDGSTQTI
jgi:hypothetical protein